MILIECEVEMCGYVGCDDDGCLVIIEIFDGIEVICILFDWFKWDVYVFFYIYSSYSFNYDSEVLLMFDLEFDEVLGINGWILILGGCLWYYDSDVMIVYMVCDVGCLL